MDIIRAGLDDLELFNKEELSRGACCFYSEDRLCKYFFEIKLQEAVVHTENEKYIQEAIDEFLFYSGFVCYIRNTRGEILRERNASNIRYTPVEDIQPSQFYINRRKLENCKTWIKRQTDIMIPIAIVDGKKIAQDGHTRLRAAVDLGYKGVYTYAEDFNEYILEFLKEAVNRGITSVHQMEILSDEDYELKWHKYCADFFRQN